MPVFQQIRAHIFQHISHQGGCIESKTFAVSGGLAQPEATATSPTLVVAIYSSALQAFQDLPLNDGSVPSVWAGTWAKAESLSLMAPSKKVTLHEDKDMRAIFWNAPLPPWLCDFVYQSLWCNLRLRVRLAPWLQIKDCPPLREGRDYMSRPQVL